MALQDHLSKHVRLDIFTVISWRWATVVVCAEMPSPHIAPSHRSFLHILWPVPGVGPKGFLVHACPADDESCQKRRHTISRAL